MLTISKPHAVELLNRSANALEQVDAELTREIREAIKFSVFASDAKVARQAKPKPPKVLKLRVVSSESLERAQKLAALAESGATKAEAARAFNVTRQRIQQLAKQLGIQFKKSHKMADRLAALKEVTRARVESKWGVPLETQRYLRRSGVIREFEENKNSALSRAVPWSLTFFQWYEIWMNSGHFHERGRGKGKYVLGRVGATGPYAIGNVRVLKYEDNVRATRMKGSAPNEVPGVWLAYPNLSRGWVARVGRQQLGHFASQDAAAKARGDFLAAHVKEAA